MAVFYTLYQNNCENFASESKGKWYSRVIVIPHLATQRFAFSNTAPRT